MQGISGRQTKVIAELLTGKTIKDAAAAHKTNEATVHRWFEDPAFQQAYTESRQQLLNHSITTLQLKFDKAVEVLSAQMENAENQARDQIKAAEIIIGKVLQTAELTKRIAELEAIVAQQEQDMMYKVVFDLRKLSREDRETLAGINDRSQENA